MTHDPPDPHEAPPRAAAFDVVVLGGSAGAFPTALGMLRALDTQCRAALVFAFHLPPLSGLIDYFRAASGARTVEWVGPESVLDAGKVLICPPRECVELLPNGTFVLTPCERGALDAPIDRLLASVARSFGDRAIAVVLSGMGRDGAAGAKALHEAGGCVVVQSLPTSAHPGMPDAAIAAGAADLVVPSADLGQVVSELLAGTPRPRARSEVRAIQRAFGSQGEVARIAQAYDWAATPLGPVLAWPPELVTLVRTVIDSPHAMAVWWGPRLLQIYNDAWRAFLGARKHPQALGEPVSETWAEHWHAIGPLAQQVIERGEAVSGQDYLVMVDRHGVPEEVYVNFSYSPVRDAEGRVVGLHNIGWETTGYLLAERRMRALRDLATRTAGAGTAREVCELAAQALRAHAADVPFALFYLLDDARRQATLAGAAGLEPGAAVAPHVVTLGDGDAGWPLAGVCAQDMKPRACAALLLEDVRTRFPGLAPAAAAPQGSQVARSAWVTPLRAVGDRPPVGAMILALSPHRPFDEDHRAFFELLARQVDASLGQAHAKRLERERTERLAELDRTKTEFFANISHEFRTPLTMLLAPLDNVLRQRERLPQALVAEVEVAARNARRLLRLVNSLLDFSEIESRRHAARLEPTDLGTLTADIASAFRSAIEGAGLTLRVDIEPHLPQVPVHRDMWEKVVSNLLSNAFKYTFTGQVVVRLRAMRLHAELEVADSGVGIPKAELPHIFKRFHRVRGARGRTAEGSGIGLAIVHDLVDRMGGQISVRSVEGQGTTFTIWLPYRSTRLVDIAATPAEDGAGFASDLAVEAARWTSGRHAPAPPDVIEDLLEPRGCGALTAVPGAPEARPRVLVVDDNADVRDYLMRLLGERWEVEAVADGDAALAAARRRAPHAILADVMMPGMDGFELLSRLRAEPSLRHTPVVILTARAGEEAAIQGLAAGADDCIAKPFSPRELLARLQAVVTRSGERTAQAGPQMNR